MKNIAKCRLCGSVIESLHQKDHVTCTCGEISVDGGDEMRCAARNFENFLRIDDEGNEIVVKVQMEDAPKREELLKYLKEMHENMEKLPINGKLTPVNHYDLSAALLLIYSIFKAKD